MSTLLVKRKAYKRKAYTRKGGIHVKASSVDSATFKVDDKGKPGRTPKSEQFFHPKVHMGWTKDMAASTRRSKALRAHKGNKLSTARALQALANVTTDRETASKAKADARFFFTKHEKEKKQ